MIKHLRSYENELLVSIGKSGFIYLNYFTMREHFTNVQWVDFYYDAEKKLLGIKPLRKRGEGSYKLNFCTPANQSTGVIRARSVIELLKINHAKKKTYSAKWKNRSRLLEIGL